MSGGQRPVLRAVNNHAGLPQGRKKPMTVVAAAKAGDRIAELEAMRLVVAKAIQSPDTQARDLASLTRRLIDIGREVDEVERKLREAQDSGEVPDDEDWGGV